MIDQISEGIEIPATEPFANCKLGRKQYASVLSNIVSGENNGFVLALNGKWGAGKTTFVKMWQAELELKGHRTLYFNAWENDFASEPLIAILGELSSLTEGANDDIKTGFRNLIKLALKFAKVAVTGVLTEATGVDMDKVLEKDNHNSIAAQIENYKSAKREFVAIKEALATFVQKVCGDKPLIFIVDELDRCRPDYAVEVLEKIKHLFAVNGVVFVLSIDKEQLGNSVRGYYGSDLIDADEYLRRFIDIQYNLPEPGYRTFCRSLLNTANIPNLDISEGLISLIEVLCRCENPSLRQIEKIIIQYVYVLQMGYANSASYWPPRQLFILLYFKMTDEDLYTSIREGTIESQELASRLIDKIDNILLSEKHRRIFYDTTESLYPDFAFLITAYWCQKNPLSHQQTRTPLNEAIKWGSTPAEIVDMAVKRSENSGLMTIYDPQRLTNFVELHGNNIR